MFLHLCKNDMNTQYIGYIYKENILETNTLHSANRASIQAICMHTLAISLYTYIWPHWMPSSVVEKFNSQFFKCIMNLFSNNLFEIQMHVDSLDID